MNMRPALNSLIVCLAWLVMAASGLADDPYRDARMAMVKEIEQHVRETSLALDKESLDPRVMEAMAAVPRHRLVPERTRASAYAFSSTPGGGARAR